MSAFYDLLYIPFQNPLLFINFIISQDDTLTRCSAFHRIPDGSSRKNSIYSFCQHSDGIAPERAKRLHFRSLFTYNENRIIQDIVQEGQGILKKIQKKAAVMAVRLLVFLIVAAHLESAGSIRTVQCAGKRTVRI